MADSVRVRIAPSPTGNLHLGTARTALYNYLFAKRNKGKFILRLEDTDEERSHEAFTKDIIEGLKWLGLTWDEGPDIGGPFPPYRQTEKVDHYNAVANQLIAKGFAYFSYDTPEELAALKEDQSAEGLAPRYDNRGRHLSEKDVERFQAEGRIPAIRFKIEEPRVVPWQDHVKHDIAIQTSDLGGDMVIVKSSGVATYNFAVVVDDIDMKMTHVIRGEDHIHNTAKQLLLYEALGHQPPEFAHCALIFDVDRHKLSKRKHGEAVHIDRYRRDGYMPEALVNYLVQMSWMPPDGREIFSLQDACEIFDLDRVSKSPAVFDLKKLNWFNGEYIRSLPISLITERAKPFLQAVDLSGYSDAQFENLIDSVRGGLTTLAEVLDATRFYFERKIEVPQDLKESVLGSENARKVIEETLKNISRLPWGDPKGCKKVVDDMGAQLGVKGKDLYWPLRAALSGKVQGPDLGSLISVLGEKRVRERLESALPCRSA